MSVSLVLQGTRVQLVLQASRVYRDLRVLQVYLVAPVTQVLRDRWDSVVLLETQDPRV